MTISSKVGGPSLDTTQGITKYLRSKKSTISQIYDVSVSLLSNKSRYQLPQKEKFILELLLDRLSKQQLPQFKKSWQVWTLFQKLWISIAQQGDRYLFRSIGSSKLSHIIAESIELIETSSCYSDEKLIYAFTMSIQLVLRDTRFSFSQEQTVRVISSLLTFATSATLYSGEVLERISDIIYRLFIKSNSISEQYGKKSVSLFCGTCLPNLIYFINLPEIQNSPFQPRGVRIIDTILFSKRNIINCKVNLGIFVNSAKAQGKIGTKELVFLFKGVVPQLNIADVEEIFKGFIIRFPDASPALFNEIANTNKVLSNSFLTTLVKESLNRHATGYLDIVFQAIERNPEVGVKFANRLLTLAANLSSLDIVKALIKAYSRSKGLPKFINMWEKSIDKANVFTSLELISFISRYLIDLPFLELQSLMRDLIYEFRDNPSKCVYPLLSIVHGFFPSLTGTANLSISMALTSSIKSLKPQFIEILTISEKWKDSKLVWQLISAIFMLYTLPELDIDIKAIVEQYNEQKHNEFYFITLLRIFEQDRKFVDQHAMKHFTSTLKHSKSMEFKNLVFTRWLVLLENLLDGKDIQKVVQYLFENANENNDFVELVLSNPVMHEQPILMNAIINYLIENFESLTNIINLINLISIYCFEKFQRIQLLDKLYERLTNDSDVSTARCVVRLLSLPTFKSKIEGDANSLLSLLSNSYNDSIFAAILEIFRQVCFIHLKESNIEYANDVIKCIMDHINECSETNLVLLTAAITFLKAEQNYPLKNTNVISKFITSVASKIEIIMKNVDKFDSPTNFNKLCDIIVQLNCIRQNLIGKDDLKQFVSLVGSKFTDSKSLQESLFETVCNFNNYYDEAYVFSLYTNLGSSPSTNSSLHIFIFSLDESEFEYWWLNVSETSMIGNFDSYVTILIMFLESLRKPSNEQSKGRQQHLVIKTFSYLLSLLVKSPERVGKESISILSAIKSVISNNSWALTQYSIEMILVIASVISDQLLEVKKKSDDVCELYIQLAQTLANVLLFQRFRLSGRLHLLDITLAKIMKLLFKRPGYTKAICSSNKCADAWQRLMESLCEPSITIGSKRSGADEGDSNAAASIALSHVKMDLRRLLPTIILHYLRLFLTFKIEPEVRDNLTGSIYQAFKSLSENELNQINASVDARCRPAFKKVYDEYNRFGKWRQE